ncbi:MAG: NACHT domain-containing protein, partial [Actinomadura sp.]
MGIALAVPPLAVALVRWWRSVRRRAPLTTDDIAVAKDVLAGMVAEQWRNEAAIRSLDDPDPMPVQWRLTARGELIDHPAHVAPGAPPLAGSSDQIAALTKRFRELRRRRLVIMGGPGTGKTTLAVQLLRELLATWREDEPVPVLLSVASWDAKAFPRLHDWLTERLGQDYPALRSPELGAELPQKLTARGHILPVLDGLDELPDAARTAVITALNRSLSNDDQLILTSRITEFAQAVRAAGDVLTSAAVIESEPLTPTAAVDYLRSCLPAEPGSAWKQILTRLKTPDHQAGPAAVALAEITSTPLGLWLLRTTYIGPDADPAPLLSNQFVTAAALRAHLFDQTIPALIDRRRPSNDPAELFRPRRTHDPEKVRGWLSYLAHHLNHIAADDNQTSTRDFAWWQLAHRTLNPHTVRLAVGLVGGLVSGIAAGGVTGLADGIVSGLEDGIAGGLAGGLAASSWLKQTPGFANLTRRPAPLSYLIKGGLVVGLVFGLVVGLIVGFEHGLVRGLAGGLAAGLVSGFTGMLVAGLIHRVETPTPADQASTPLITWRADRALNLSRT